MSAGEYPQINPSKRPKDGGRTGSYESNGTTFTVTKGTDDLPKGFFKHIHKPNKEITLNGYIQRGTRIGTGVPIDNVESVYVYYWEGATNTPILLGIKRHNQEPKYYGMGPGGATWMLDQVDKLNELDALDEQNCKINKAIPLNIQGPQSTSIPKESKATCLKTKRKIELVGGSKNPPGSEYVTTAYSIPGNTKISRVTYKNQPTDIHPSDVVEKIRLYSYPSAINVPLMLEFKPPGNEGSKWFYSTNVGGQNWTEYIGYSSDFYDGGGDPKPTAKLSEKLDEVLCKWYNNVTLNLIKSHSETHARSKTKYCCNEHKGDARISVIKGEIRVNGQIMTSYYQHTITSPGSSLGGIYYKDGGQRKKISLLGSPFPISVNSVYAFYCTGDGPSLIYVDSQSAMTKGWYKKGDDSDNWIWTYTGIKQDLGKKELECKQWRKLKIVLEDCSCNKLNECSEGKNQLTVEQLRQELAKEEEKAKNERQEEIQKAAAADRQSRPLVSGPPSAAVSGTSSSSESSGGSSSSFESSGVGSSSVNSSSSSSQTQLGTAEHGGATGGNGKLLEAATSVGRTVGYVLGRSAIAGGVGLHVANEILKNALPLAVELANGAIKSITSDTSDYLASSGVSATGANLQKTVSEHQDSASSIPQSPTDAQPHLPKEPKPTASIEFPGGPEPLAESAVTTATPPSPGAGATETATLPKETSTTEEAKSSEDLKPETASDSLSSEALKDYNKSEDPQRITGSPDLVTTPTPEAPAAKPVTEPPQFPVQAATQEPATSPEAQPVVVEATLTAGLGPWLTFGASSGTLTGAGGLTGFGWWMFKRSKGDPWVRQI